MCTISIVPTPGLVRLVMNRDEQRSRPVEVPPAVSEAGPRRAEYPVDPVGPGTWVGVNDAGVIAALLNTTPVGRSVAPGLRSRGVIVPAVLACASLQDAVVCASELATSDVAGFRLLVLHRRRLAIIRGGAGERPRVAGQNLREPIVLASSSLGDRIVEPLRQRLFADLMRMLADPLVAQEHFHRHQWAARPEVSVLMSRSDARTVSRTAIDLVEGAVPRLAHALVAADVRAAQEYAWAS